MINPANKPTLKERIADARAKLGIDKANAILADTLAADKKKYDREFLTLHRQAEALEQVIKSPRSTSQMLTAKILYVPPQTQAIAPSSFISGKVPVPKDVISWSK